MPNNKSGVKIKQAATIMVVTAIAAIGVFIYLTISPFLSLKAMAGEMTRSTSNLILMIEKRAVVLMSNKLGPTEVKSRYKIVNQMRQVNANLAHNLQKNDFKLTYQNGRISDLSFGSRKLKSDNFKTAVLSDGNLYRAFSNSVNIDRAVYQNKLALRQNQEMRINLAGFNQNDKDFDKQERNLTRVNRPGKRFALFPEEDQPTNSWFSLIKNDLKRANQTADQIEKKGESPIRGDYQPFLALKSDFINKKSSCAAVNNARSIQDYNKVVSGKQQAQAAINFRVGVEKIALDKSSSEEMDYIIRKMQPNNKAVKSATNGSLYQHFVERKDVAIDQAAENYINGSGSTLNKALLENGCRDDNFFGNIFGLGTIPANINLSNNDQKFITNNTLATMSNLKTAPNIRGEDFTNSVIAGMSYYNSQLARRMVGTILTQEQAAEYKNQQSNLLAFKDSTVDPFDTNNSHSMIAKLNLKLFALTNGSTSVGQFLGNILAAANNNLPAGKIKARADDFRRLNLCQDSEYLKLNKYLDGQKIALDAACNPIYALRPDLLEIDPEQVIEKLVASGDLVVDQSSCDANGLDCELKEASRLKYFKQNCLTKDASTLGQDINKDLLCMAQGQDEQLFPVYFLDKLVLEIIDGVSKS